MRTFCDPRVRKQLEDPGLKPPGLKVPGIGAAPGQGFTEAVGQLYVGFTEPIEDFEFKSLERHLESAVKTWLYHMGRPAHVKGLSASVEGVRS